MRNPSRILAAVAAAGLMAPLSACQVKPGEYRVYKIAMLPPTAGADCGFDVDPRNYTTFFSTQTIQLFATDGDDYFLEWSDGMNNAVVYGTRSGADYTFEGVEESVLTPTNNTTITETTSLTVALSIQGHKIDGEFVVFNRSVCGGNCDAFNNTQCTLTGSFVGSELKDVEFERGV